MINKGLFKTKEEPKKKEAMNEVDLLLSMSNHCFYCGEQVGPFAVFSGKHNAIFCDVECMHKIDEEGEE